MYRVIHTYTHPGGRIGVMVEAQCETDFGSRTKLFGDFVHDVALQIASMKPKYLMELLSQKFVKDMSVTVSDMLAKIAGELKEECHILRFKRWEADRAEVGGVKRMEH